MINFLWAQPERPDDAEQSGAALLRGAGPEFSRASSGGSAAYHVLLRTDRAMALPPSCARPADDKWRSAGADPAEWMSQSWTRMTYQCHLEQG